MVHKCSLRTRISIVLILKGIGMDTILTPLSFKTRRAPLLGKVERDADTMYGNARYVIVLDEDGNVVEQRFNRRIDDEVVDCLAVFAPFTYKGARLERVLVLEIGFRRFVPYAQTEHRLGASTRRGPVLRFRKGEERKPRTKVKANKKRAYQIPARIPIARLTDDALFDIMPALAKGVQECVDAIIRTWTETDVSMTRWTRAGKKWMTYEVSSSISVRFPKSAVLLCATASFAEIAWRQKPNHQLAASARAIRDMLRPFTSPKKRFGKDEHGNFSDEYVRGSQQLFYVSDRLRKKVSRGYSSVMIEKMLDMVGPAGSPKRRLVEQVWRVFKVPKPEDNPLLKAYQSKYGEMKDLLLERWPLENGRDLFLECRKKEWAKKMAAESKPYRPHARNSLAFAVFVSKEAKAEMTQAYVERRARKLAEETTSTQSQLVEVLPSVEDDDIPWDTSGAPHTGTNDECPF